MFAAACRRVVGVPTWAYAAGALKEIGPMPIHVNGSAVPVPNDPRVSLLDLLRERLHLTGTKVGCNQGACGACTVLVDGERIVSCLALAVQFDGREITTVEGLGQQGALHPLQAAFVEHDGFQCGYCTPGQICSAIGMAGELRRGMPSHVTQDLGAETVAISRTEFQERMSGNLCRCGAHNGIIDAISDVYGSDRDALERFALVGEAAE
ncbi:MAG: 2Fe-2S iron-sulfur cluster-binding protein [Janthinobacterium lividum]